MRVDDLVAKVQSYAPDADLEMLVNAYLYSAQAHDGQQRKSGEAYLTHPLAVAGILADMKMDLETIATGLLHDTMEDCMTRYEDIKSLFGEDVANLVDGVTKIGKLRFRTQMEAQAENFRKLVLAMSNDIRVILVKLADRLHNMRTMQHMKPEKRKKISHETMDIFVPIANRLGLSKLKSELEDLCFSYLEPEIHAELSAKLAERAPDHEVFIEQFGHQIEDHLRANGIECRVYGRVKFLLSVYRKMVAQNVPFEQVHDLLAFRVMVESVGQCYAALGLIHGMYPHHPNRLKDYIAQPKSNGYQSLHTVIVPEGRQVEVQMRTPEMHQVAEFGIAAHWRYKEGHLDLSKEDISKIARLRALFEAAQEVSDGAEFLETLKVDLFSREIFVFTPQGDVKIFPQGATALDFAYSIHTEVGHHCTGATIDGRMVPMRHVLQDGDRVEILTSPQQKPSRAWLEIAHTGRALSKIRRAIRETEHAQATLLGKELLEKALEPYGENIGSLERQQRLIPIVRHYGHRELEHLFLAIGNGTLTTLRITNRLFPNTQPRNTGIGSFFQRMRNRSTSPVLIHGEDDVLSSFARCCNPLPGEAVGGFITRGRGITIHRLDCVNYQNSEHERKILVQWHDEGQNVHSAELSIRCTGQMGILADLGAACKAQGINITRMEANSAVDEEAIITLEISIQHVSQIGILKKNIQKINGVLSVIRK